MAKTLNKLARLAVSGGVLGFVLAFAYVFTR
jgi:hypothetical protein